MNETPLSVSEQRALARMGRDWIAANVAGGNTGPWRSAPEYREAVAAVETATDRAAREAAALTKRHERERAELAAKHEGRA